MCTSENIIELIDVRKVFDDETVAVDCFNLQVKKGEFVTFLGPSGCGKTTTLRMIAGFDIPTSGKILLNGEDISRLPPNKRPVNTVFQKYALFPHLNVYENIAFGLRLKKKENKYVPHILVRFENFVFLALETRSHFLVASDLATRPVVRRASLRAE